MTLQEIIKKLDLCIFTNTNDLVLIVPENCYASDMLSCVMTGAKSDWLWITLQSHINIVAVAALLELSAIIITEGNLPDKDTINKADQQNIILLGTSKQSYEIAGKLWEMGLHN